MPIFVHVAHGHQRAVFNAQCGVRVGAGVYACPVAGIGNDGPKLWVTIVFVGHVFYKVWQLIAGIDTFEVGCTVDVIPGINQPMGIEYNDGIHTKGPTTFRNFFVAGYCRVATALVGAVKLGNVH